MQRVTLTQSGLGVSPDEVSRVFAPFVVARHAAGDPAWEAELARRDAKFRRRYWRRRLLGGWRGWQRHGGTVKAEYEKAWASIDYAEYDPARTPPRVSPWEWRGERYAASDVGGTRVRQLLLVRVLEQIRPRRVLEVGCGNGVNLMLLAGRLPEVSFTGADLTREGPRAARALQREAELPRPMQAYAPLPLADVTAFRRVDFATGDATRLPFPDGAFDLVVTILALEQMERVRDAALREIARVAGRHTVMIEPFAELNDRGRRLHYTVARDYFRGRIDDLLRYGLVPKLALDDFPQESFLGACLVLAEKRGATP
jgi:SAM-dependent methyltransferase